MPVCGSLSRLAFWAAIIFMVECWSNARGAATVMRRARPEKSSIASLPGRLPGNSTTRCGTRWSTQGARATE